MKFIKFRSSYAIVQRSKYFDKAAVDFFTLLK